MQHKQSFTERNRTKKKKSGEMKTPAKNFAREKQKKSIFNSGITAQTVIKSDYMGAYAVIDPSDFVCGRIRPTPSLATLQFPLFATTPEPTECFIECFYEIYTEKVLAFSAWVRYSIYGA